MKGKAHTVIRQEVKTWLPLPMPSHVTSSQHVIVYTPKLSRILPPPPKGKGCGLVAFTHFQREVKYPVVLLVPWSWQLLETSSTAIATFFLGSDGLTHHVWISSRAYHTHVLPASKLPILKLCSLVLLPKDSP